MSLPAPSLVQLTHFSSHALPSVRYHLGQLRAKIAKLRHELLEPAKKSGKPGEGFDVMKSGDARVALIGFPSVGKSSFLSAVTDTKSEAAAYEFTTLTCQPVSALHCCV